MKQIFIFVSMLFSCYLSSMDSKPIEKLCAACSHGDLNMVKKLLERRDFDINEQDSCGKCPLHYAAQAGHKPIVSCLLEYGALIEVQSKNGERPVHLAAKKGYVEILRSLIQFRDKKNKAPDTNIRDMRGYTPMHYAAEQGHLEAVQYLQAWGASVDIDAENKLTPYSLAKTHGHEHVARFIELISKTEMHALRPKL